ncbi:MAG: ATP-binding protein, partial [Planctomycetes bacterium]|nr:ATP-binding protein [Planctomycetota bacterium]
MLILHDTLAGDLTHIQAFADLAEGFSLYDYVRIRQADGREWIAQIIQPNQNISTVGNRLDPTILHGLRLMHSHPDVQSVQSVQVFDLLILGEYQQGQLLTPRLRPLPGSMVFRLDARETASVIEVPGIAEHEDGSSNVIGELLNAAGVPLCLDGSKFHYHIMVAGGTGSGKSNVAANLIDQAVKCGKCVLVHDAKPDYGLIRHENTDPRVQTAWERFADYRLFPHGAPDVRRIGFYGKCDPDLVDEVVGFRCSDFHPEMLAGLFFTGSEMAEQNGFEGFVGAADALYQRAQLEQLRDYTLDLILEEVRRRNDVNGGVPLHEAIHELTARSIIRKVAGRRRAYPWLDAVGLPLRPGPSNRFRGSRLDNANSRVVRPFHLAGLVAPGRVLVIDYSQMEDQSYAVLLSYFLRECQRFRKQTVPADSPPRPGVVQLVDEAHRIMDNRSRHGPALANAFGRVMREGRSVDHSIILSLQNASQIPPRVMNNLNTRIV